MFLSLSKYQLRRNRQLALALAVFSEPNLDEGERVVDGPRLLALLPEPDVAIGRDDELVAAVWLRYVPRVAELPRDVRTATPRR